MSCLWRATVRLFAATTIVVIAAACRPSHPEFTAWPGGSTTTTLPPIVAKPLTPTTLPQELKRALPEDLALPPPTPPPASTSSARGSTSARGSVQARVQALRGSARRSPRFPHPGRGCRRVPLPRCRAVQGRQPCCTPGDPSNEKYRPANRLFP
jgi:hypothetical protein